jgi:DNA-binding transcriptional MerR regulator
MFGVTTSLIRYWESEFTFLRPKKNRKGDRQFTKKDIEYLNKIYHLVKERGFTLDGAKKELKKKDLVIPAQPSKKIQLTAKLKALRSKIEKLRDSL